MNIWHGATNRRELRGASLNAGDTASNANDGVAAGGIDYDRGSSRRGSPSLFPTEGGREESFEDTRTAPAAESPSLPPSSCTLPQLPHLSQPRLRVITPKELLRCFNRMKSRNMFGEPPSGLPFTITSPLPGQIAPHGPHVPSQQVGTSPIPLIISPGGDLEDNPPGGPYVPPTLSSHPPMPPINFFSREHLTGGTDAPQGSSSARSGGAAAKLLAHLQRSQLPPLHAMKGNSNNTAVAGGPVPPQEGVARGGPPSTLPPLGAPPVRGRAPNGLLSEASRPPSAPASSDKDVPLWRRKDVPLEEALASGSGPNVNRIYSQKVGPLQQPVGGSDSTGTAFKQTAAGGTSGILGQQPALPFVHASRRPLPAQQPGAPVPALGASGATSGRGPLSQQQQPPPVTTPSAGQPSFLLSRADGARLPPAVTRGTTGLPGMAGGAALNAPPLSLLPPVGPRPLPMNESGGGQSTFPAVPRGSDADVPDATGAPRAFPISPPPPQLFAPPVLPFPMPPTERAVPEIGFGSGAAEERFSKSQIDALRPPRIAPPSMPPPIGRPPSPIFPSQPSQFQYPPPRRTTLDESFPGVGNLIPPLRPLQPVVPSFPLEPVAERPPPHVAVPPMYPQSPNAGEAAFENTDALLKALLAARSSVAARLSAGESAQALRGVRGDSATTGHPDEWQGSDQADRWTKDAETGRRLLDELICKVVGVAPPLDQDRKLPAQILPPGQPVPPNPASLLPPPPRQFLPNTLPKYSLAPATPSVDPNPASRPPQPLPLEEKRPGLPVGSPPLRIAQAASPAVKPAQPVCKYTLLDPVWQYKSPEGCVEGPFSSLQMHTWWKGNYFTPDLEMRYDPSIPWNCFGNLFPKSLYKTCPPFCGFPLLANGELRFLQPRAAEPLLPPNVLAQSLGERPTPERGITEPRLQSQSVASSRAAMMTADIKQLLGMKPSNVEPSGEDASTTSGKGQPKAGRKEVLTAQKAPATTAPAPRSTAASPLPSGKVWKTPVSERVAPFSLEPSLEESLQAGAIAVKSTARAPSKKAQTETKSKTVEEGKKKAVEVNKSGAREAGENRSDEDQKNKKLDMVGHEAAKDSTDSSSMTKNDDAGGEWVVIGKRGAAATQTASRTRRQAAAAVLTTAAAPSNSSPDTRKGTGGAHTKMPTLPHAEVSNLPDSQPRRESQVQASDATLNPLPISAEQMEDIRALMNAFSLRLETSLLQFLFSLESAEAVLDVLKDNLAGQDLSQLNRFATEFVSVRHNPFRTVTHKPRGSNNNVPSVTGAASVSPWARKGVAYTPVSAAPVYSPQSTATTTNAAAAATAAASAVVSPTRSVAPAVLTFPAPAPTSLPRGHVTMPPKPPPSAAAASSLIQAAIARASDNPATEASKSGEASQDETLPPSQLSEAPSTTSKSKGQAGKRSKKSRGVAVDPSLLGFRIKSTRIMQGAIDYGD